MGSESAVSRNGRPCRPIPENFAERWVRVGWFGAPDEFNAHTRSIGRWLDELGRDELILARKRYVDATRTIASRAQRKRYAMPIRPADLLTIVDLEPGATPPTEASNS